MKTLRPALAVAVLLLTAASAAHADFPLTACGTAVPRGQTGYLTGDLSCSVTSPSVTLAKNATLDLRGYTLTLFGMDGGIVCEDGRCAVVSTGAPGRIVAGAPGPVAFHPVIRHITSKTGKVVLRNLAIDVTPPGSAGQGVLAIGTKSIDAEKVSVSNASDVALAAPRVRAEDVVLVDNWIGIRSGAAVAGQRVSATGGGYGIVAGRARLSEVTVHGALYNGVQTDKGLTLRDSDVSGNGLGGSGADVVAGRRPLLRNTTCGTSQVMGAPPGTSWGVCLND